MRPTIVQLKSLIKGLNLVVKGFKHIEITGLSTDSKQVGPGFLYIAVRGERFDGNTYISEAIGSGAVCILTDLYNPFLKNVVQLICEESKKMEALLASRFYGHCDRNLFLVGITGTNGKTTTSYLVKHLLEEKERVGLIGTIACMVGEHHIKSRLTTPDCITCYKLLKEMVVSKLTSAVMEVSSHALCQNRVDGIFFDVALFTNLSAEHLDYHKSFEAYAEAKMKLFHKVKEGGKVVINHDSDWADKIKKRSCFPIITYGIQRASCFFARDIAMDLSGSSFILNYLGKEKRIKIPLIGQFNIYNTLAAISVAFLKGVRMEKIQERLSSFKGVPGRLQPIFTKKGVYLFIDFAHTEHALQNVLQTLQALKKGRIITVFGCGGWRDRFKRPRMARVCERLSDFVIATLDNPRGEDPKEIFSDLQKGFFQTNHLIEMDRREAIRKAIFFARKGDCVLIAGKGHETVQIFEKKSLPFNDFDIAEELSNQLT